MTDKKNIYICAAGHTGSTLLDMFLGSHSECESLGELAFLPMDFALNRKCGCGEDIRNCSLWSQVASKLGIDTVNNPYELNLGFLKPKVGDPKKTNPYAIAMTRLVIGLKYYQLRYGLSFLKPFVSSLDVGVENTLKVYDLVRELTAKKVMIDSTKHHTKAVTLYKADPVHTRIILLVRDGRGVFYSNLKRGFGKRYSLNAWLKHYGHAVELIQKNVKPEHVLQVHYEDFISNPETVLSNICAFIGINYEPEMLAVDKVDHHNVNGNDIKFKPISELKIDNTWRSKLSEQDLAYFETHAGTLNRAFGYS